MGASDAEIDSALRGMAERLGSAQSALMAANEKDLAAAVSAGMSPGCRIACE
jgi:glutamate-5-semialdehyde dehydrogenase